MIKDFKAGESIVKIDYELCFYRDYAGGFAFPCDENGNVDENMNPAAIENYHWCMENKDKFPYYFNEVVKTRHSWREPNTGTCHCGQKMELVNQYMGACECPKCGQWYNIWRQELNNPRTWRNGSDW